MPSRGGTDGDTGDALRARIRRALDATGVDWEIVECEPDHADTADFAAHYGYALEDSANAILVGSKTGERRFVMCVVLATTRLDVNKAVRKRMGVRKCSFAGPDEARAVTGMELGGVTPVGLPEDLPVWVDARVMTRPRVVLGGGDRHSKIVVPPDYFRRIANVEIVEDLAKPLET